MILEFKFNYISQNTFLENLLQAICQEFKIAYKIGKKGSVVTLHVEADEQVLANFSDFIAKRLPMSIFFKSIAVEVVENIEDISTTIDEFTLLVPYTPKTLFACRDKDSNLYLSPLINNEIGATSFSASSVSLVSDGSIVVDAKDMESFAVLYEKVAKIISSGEEVYIESISGSYTIAKLDESFKSRQVEDFVVTPTDLSIVGKIAVARDNEIKTLASLEKPSIKFKINTIYKGKNILSSSRVKIKLADELLLQNICEKLQLDGVDFICRAKAKSSTCNHCIVINGSFNLLPQIEVSVLKNGEILIVSGDGYSTPLLRENLKKFDVPALAQFASVMQEHNLFEKSVSCFYMSKTNDDLLIHSSSNTGVLDLVKFPIIYDFGEIFANIESSSMGKRLIDNYKKEYFELYKRALKSKIPDDAPKSIYTIWGIVAVILGISQSFEDGGIKIVELAEDFGGKKGPRIDYHLVDRESIRSDFSMIKLIMSSISFKIAGVEDMILSFGLMDSLVDFLNDSAESCKENLSSEKILLCGSMFDSRRLMEDTCKNIMKNSQICLNIELPIDN